MAVGLMAALGLQTAARVVVQSSVAGQEMPVKIFGRGATIHLVEGEGRTAGDTTWTSTPAQMSVNLRRGELTIVSLGSSWVEVRVEAGTSGTFTAKASKVLIKEADGEIQVVGLRP